MYNIMRILTELKKLISSSTLIKQEEQNQLYNVLGFAPEEELLLVVELFREDKKWISWIYDNYKKKNQAIITNDQKELKNIEVEERKLLDTITQSNP